MVKKVICGISDEGASTILSISPAERRVASNGGVHEEIWMTTPDAPLSTEDGTADPSAPLFPPMVGGTRFRVSTFEPGAVRPFHQTETVDYGVVLSGMVTLTMQDRTEETLEAGDCLVQLGGIHSWHNGSDVAAIVAFVTLAVEDGADINYR